MEELLKMQKIPLALRLGIEKGDEGMKSGLQLFDFDEALKKMSELENKLGVFKTTKFRRIIKGCRRISDRLAYLKQLQEIWDED